MTSRATYRLLNFRSFFLTQFCLPASTVPANATDQKYKPSRIVVLEGFLLEPGVGFEPTTY